MSISFAINVAIWALTPAGEQDGGFTGGVLALYITVLVVYVQAVTQLLPFAMGVSLSRRTFFLGTALVAVVQSLVYGIALAVLVAIENATGGWGSGLNFWAPGPFEVDNFGAAGAHVRGADARLHVHRRRHRHRAQALGTGRHLGTDHRVDGRLRRPRDPRLAGSTRGVPSAAGSPTSPWSR